MEQNTKLNTILAQQIFNFSKLHLRKFIPGALIPSANQKQKQTTSNQKPIQKQSFNHLLNTMAAEKLEFLPLFEIFNNNHFTITVNFNIPKNDFLSTFHIPSFKPHVHKFNEWFETFFKSYQKQFTNINQQKVYNYLKFQIATKLADECKKLLPLEFQISEPNSLRNHLFQTNKKALHHIHTCKDSKCSILKNQEDQKHNYKNLSSYFFKQSFTTYSAPEKDTYFKAAAQNDNISELGLEQALEKTIVPTIDPYILARIILYYNIQSQSKFSIAQIKQSYEQEYLI
ncbi:hypothetical protein F8M41_010036 [Gigaspora margarita]|uniref:Uncharacterized protein n=1 Tax=Gigaspora margarita TaxID=4874 RepID=A0A8H4AUL7_GIGMA|nr:hypothetical protein F8M41_010036 [Gigaspora margarita]